jgi:tetratricopeptide (TPR) repeat protein
MFGLGRVLFGEGNYPEAEKLISQVLASEVRMTGPEHPDTLRTAGMLGSIYSEEGKVAQSQQLLEKTVQGFRNALGPEHPDTLYAAVRLASAYEAQGSLARAESLWETTLEGYRHAVGDENPDTVEVKEGLGEFWMKQRRYAEAEPILRQCVAFREKTEPDAWRRFRANSLLGASLANQKKYAEAEPMLLTGYEGMKQREAQIPAYEKRHLNKAGEQIVALYTAWPKPAELAQWRQRIGGEPQLRIADNLERKDLR